MAKRKQGADQAQQQQRQQQMIEQQQQQQVAQMMKTPAMQNARPPSTQAPAGAMPPPQMEAQPNPLPPAGMMPSIMQQQQSNLGPNRQMAGGLPQMIRLRFSQEHIAAAQAHTKEIMATFQQKGEFGRTLCPRTTLTFVITFRAYRDVERAAVTVQSD